MGPITDDELKAKLAGAFLDNWSAALPPDASVTTVSLSLLRDGVRRTEHFTATREQCNWLEKQYGTPV